MEEFDKVNVTKIVKMALIKTGVRCDLTGFSYLSTAIELAIEKPVLCQRLCKGLYAEVGKIYSIENESCVERSIRHAIDTTFNQKTFEGINEMFGVELFSAYDKPTAGELIKLIVEYYNLGLYKKDIKFKTETNKLMEKTC